MAARRHHTAPVDALDRRIDWTDVGARATAGLTSWVLGPGLLSLHALAFVVVGLGMLFHNILTDPADLTVGEPLLRWGIVLAGHAAAVLIGWTIWRVIHPPAPRPVYRPIPRTALGGGRPTPLVAEPVWYANGSTNGSVNGHLNGSSPNGFLNGHTPHSAGAWPEPPQARPVSERRVVTSRRVTTMVVATARDSFASARRRYRRDQPPPRPNGSHPPQPWAYPGAAPAPAPNGLPQPVNEVDPAHAPAEQPTVSWTAAARDEVISVTQAGPEPAPSDAERAVDDEHGHDPVRAWLDGYLDGKGREREARWTWIEAAASTWLARGEAPEPALPAPAAPLAADNARLADPPPAPMAADEPGGPPPPAPSKADGAANGNGASPA